MRKKEVQHIPIRSFDDPVKPSTGFKFEVSSLKSENKGEQVKIAAHRHDYYHILYIKNGFGEHSIDFKTYKIKPNSLFFVSPGQVHALEVSGDVEGFVITFDPEFYLLNNTLQKLLDYPFFHSLNNSPAIYLTDKNDKIVQAILEINEEYNSLDSQKGDLLRSLLEVLLIRTSRVYHGGGENTPDHLTYQLRKLEALIDSRFKELKLLDDYANLMHLSPKHLNSLCKKGLNKTVTNLIHERTLLEAKRLLLFTDNSVSEIAYELGFMDKSYFMRFFKKHMGFTTEAYRKSEATR